MDAVSGRLDVMVDAEEWSARSPAVPDLSASQHGVGRELFRLFRTAAVPAESGGGILHIHGET